MKNEGKSFLQIWATDAISLWLVSNFLSSEMRFSGLGAIIFTAFALAFLNSTIQPILKLISFPITILTFGLFSLVINGIVLKLAFTLSTGSYIASLGTAIWASILLAILNSIIERIFR